MRNPQTDKMNHDFVVGCLQHMEPKNAQFALVISLSEDGQLLLMENPLLTKKDTHQLLTEAIRAIENNLDNGKIIQLLQ